MAASCQMECAGTLHGQKCVDPGPLPSLTGKTPINQAEVCLNTYEKIHTPSLSVLSSHFQPISIQHKAQAFRTSALFSVPSRYLATGLLNGLNMSASTQTSFFHLPSYFMHKMVTNCNAGYMQNS